MERKQFIKTLGITSLVIPATSVFAFSQNQEEPKLDKALVKKFVGGCHGKFDMIKELLKEHPTLLNAAHDWRRGDFETGLGAASHMGNKEIAKYLLDNGAQANIFTAALFGRLDILKPMLDFNPALLNAKGPHGLTLLHHANKGGDEALEVTSYLQSLGLKETQFKLY
ncbi:ankyrin repeat domain-containing protein [Seonamhaeicola marinus]|uniref:ankyrin repeat domain-containing protein n=1 Tax=Seonamhaeicola marinus TaxID=1912246 RepID=UPI001651FEE5|nr:ankyrin repeat domain-containing protein [Seonamhaeicola marinus]